MKGDMFNWLRRAVYLIILIGLVVFLLRQGIEPWRILIANPQAFIGVMAVTTLGILVQANAFRLCLPQGSKPPPLSRLVEIWAVSGITSLLAPVVASLAMRTVLLQREGIGLKANVLATVRQTWFNCECALLAGAIVLIAYPWPVVPYLGYGLGLGWLGLWSSRKCLLAYSGSYVKLHFPSALRIAYSPSWPTLLWLSGQVVTMAVNYWLVFMLMSAPLAWHESILLATLTILASLIVFIPNGLGVLDALWVWVGRQHGLDTGDAVAVALTLRLAGPASAFFLWSAIALLDLCHGHHSHE